MQKARGCEEDSEDPRFWQKERESNEVLTKRCPLKSITRRVANAVQIATAVEAGILPDPGGLLDQANAFIQVAGVVSEAKRKAMKDNAGK